MKTLRSSSPSHRLVLTLLLGALAGGGGGTLRAQNQTVAGDLSVGGVADVNGNSLMLGSWSQTPTKFGLSTQFGESSDHVSAVVTFNQTSTKASWFWRQATDAQGPSSYAQMELDPDGSLSLFPASLTPPSIFLNASGGQSFITGNLRVGGSLTAGGSNNQMSNQSITGAASVLTVGLGDIRYATRGSGSGTAFGPQSTTVGVESSAIGNRTTATGVASTAVGNATTASGLISTAIGCGASAPGDYSTALGDNSVASGPGSVAMGIGCQATAVYALAVGYGATANAQSASAFGNGSIATAVGATALGYGAAARGYESSALGMYSTTSNNWTITLGCFSIASGEMSTALGLSSAATGDQSLSLGSGSGAGGLDAASVGYHSSASGLGATSLGTYSNASGTYATALSYAALASGDYSVAAGRTAATSQFQTAVGSYGLSGGNATAWVPTDDLFTVGNGQSAAAPSNAFTVKKNGDATVAGKLAVAGPIIIQNPQGDLAMGEFTAHP